MMSLTAFAFTFGGEEDAGDDGPDEQPSCENIIKDIWFYILSYEPQ